MPAFVSDSLSAVQDLEGVYAVRIPAPPPITTPGTDWMGYVGHFAWGPVDVVTVVESTPMYLDTFAPAGQGYGFSGHATLARTQPALLKIVRIKATGAAIAKSTLYDVTDGIKCVKVSAKFYGALALSIVIAAATDGDADHFDLSVTCGTDTETYRNLSTLSNGAGVVLGDQSGSKYLAQLVVGAGVLTGTSRPVNGTYPLGLAATHATDLVAGADGTPAIGDYGGTAGTGDRGIAAFEGDADVKPMAVDDVGATGTLRLDVNTKLVQHARDYFPHRAFINPNSSVASVSAAITDLTTNSTAYRDERAVYVANWFYTLDETGAEVLTAPAAMVAAALTHMPHHLGINWKDPRNTRYYSKVKRLAWTAGRPSLILARKAGVTVLVKTDAGGIAPKSDVTTSVVTGRTDIARSRIEDFIIQGITAGQEVYEGGPIDPVTRAEQRSNVSNFLQPMKDNVGKGLAAQTEVISDFAVTDAASQADLDAGVNKIGVQVKTFSPQGSLVFLVQVGPTVTVTVVTPGA